MRYFSGGGTEYNGGLWSVKETPKTYTFTLLKKPFFESNCPRRMVIKKQKEKSHCLRCWEDGSFTVYPFQSGVPHVFSTDYDSI